jgi:hypothetical protein
LSDPLTKAGRDGDVVAYRLSNAAAWREADRLDAARVEETRQRISIAVAQW